MTPEPVIQIRGQDLARIWKVSPAQASRVYAPAKIDGLRDFGVDLVKALEIRKISVSNEEFEAILRAGASSMQGDPVQLAREMSLYDFFYEWEPAPTYRNTGKVVKNNPAHQAATREKLTKQIQEAEAARTRLIEVEGAPEANIKIPDIPINSTGDMLNRLRAEKLRSEVEYKMMKHQREMGFLVDREEVEQAMASAGIIIQSILSNLPHELTTLVSSLVSPEVEEEVFNMVTERVETALHALKTALAPEEDDEG